MGAVENIHSPEERKELAARDTTVSTSSGGYIDVCNPDPRHILIFDIARGLSHESRFGGQTINFYSVAQHSVLMSYIVEPEFALEALMHDAAEAYLGDVQRPIKRILTQYQVMEEVMDFTIRNKFMLPLEMSPEVKLADKQMLMAEKTQVVGSVDKWGLEFDVEPAPVTIEYWSPNDAFSKFIDRWNELNGQA